MALRRIGLAIAAAAALGVGTHASPAHAAGCGARPGYVVSVHRLHVSCAAASQIIRGCTRGLSLTAITYCRASDRRRWTCQAWHPSGERFAVRAMCNRPLAPRRGVPEEFEVMQAVDWLLVD
jgi:hypothetical protein